jgi:hypothetical protein
MTNPSESAGSSSPGFASVSDDLLRLAAEKSPDKRLDLLRRVTDAYLEFQDAPSAAERYLFDDIVGTLLAKISRGDKIAASSSLSELPRIPDGIARRLAVDSDIGVAGPMVRNYRGLSDEVLVEVASSGSQDHLRAIAGRPAISPPVTDVIVRRGDQTTTHVLASNQGAQFSEQGMQQLIDKATGDSDLQALIVNRSDLTRTAMAKLEPVVLGGLAARLAGANLDVELQEAEVRKHLFGWLHDRNKNVRSMVDYVEAVRSGDASLDDLVPRLVANDRLLDASTLIAAKIDLDERYAFNIVMHGDPQLTLVLFRSVDLSWRAVRDLMTLRASKAEIGGNERFVEKADYDSVDPETARRIVRFLKVRRTAMGAASSAIAPRSRLRRPEVSVAG